MRIDPRRKRLIDRRQAAKVGRRYYAFYRGARDFRTGQATNPFPAGSEDARGWENGWKYAQSEQRDSGPPPVCRFGPGGNFVQDWPCSAEATQGKPEKKP